MPLRSTGDGTADRDYASEYTILGAAVLYLLDGLKHGLAQLKDPAECGRAAYRSSSFLTTPYPQPSFRLALGSGAYRGDCIPIVISVVQACLWHHIIVLVARWFFKTYFHVIVSWIFKLHRDRRLWVAKS